MGKSTLCACSVVPHTRFFVQIEIWATTNCCCSVQDFGLTAALELFAHTQPLSFSLKGIPWQCLHAAWFRIRILFCAVRCLVPEFEIRGKNKQTPAVPSFLLFLTRSGRGHGSTSNGRPFVFALQSVGVANAAVGAVVFLRRSGRGRQLDLQGSLKVRPEHERVVPG